MSIASRFYMLLKFQKNIFLVVKTTLTNFNKNVLMY